MSQAFVHSELPLPSYRFFRLLRLDAPPVDDQQVVSCSLETFEFGDCHRIMLLCALLYLG